MPVLQSAYRSGHSTESCLLKVMSDILDAADSGEVSLVGLLDLSAAFDTVDHDILLRRLQSSFGIGGIILHWITSFLTDRTQAVVFCGERSSVCRLNCGVPQGSVLGPLLFILYRADVIRIGSMGVKVHCYADDTQLYISGSEKDATTTASRVIECINENQFMDVIKPLETEWRQDPVYLDGFTPTVIKDPSRCPDHSRC